MKILILICLILYPLLNLPSYNVYSSTRYARIENASNIYYSNVDNKILCLAEKSYFVQIINEIDNMYKVNYNGISGYINKNDVKEITSTPFTPYPSNIKLIIGSDCNFRSSPTTKSQTNNILTTLKSGEENIEFIGRIYSDEAIDFGGTTWYFVKYLGEYGYIYNKYVKSITPIYENTEKVTYLKESSSDTQNPITHTPSILIMIILAIPLLFILLILYLPRRVSKKIKREKQPKIIDKY